MKFLNILILLSTLLFGAGLAFAQTEEMIISDPVLKEKYGHMCTSINGVEFSSLPKPDISFQKLIDRANDGDTQTIPAGIYHSVTPYHIDNNLTVIGDGLVVLDANWSCEILHIENPYATVKVKNIVFVNGRGPDGGAVDSTAKSLIFEDCTFVGDSAHEGSCIHSRGSTYAKNCSVTGNVARDTGAFTIEGADLTIDDCVFEDNYVLKNGASIYCADDVGSKEPYIHITNSNFRRNNVSINGSAIYSKGRNIYIESSDFSNNSGTTPVLIEKGHAVIRNCNFTNNQRLHDIEQTPLCGIIGLVDCSATIENCVIADNNVTARYWTGDNGGAAGGIYMSSASVTMNNTKIERNVAYGMGALAVASYSELVMNEGSISQNVAKFSEDGVNGNVAGIDIWPQAKVTLNGVTFEDNYADGYAGAIYNHGSLTLTGTNRFSNNSAQKGAAIYNDVYLGHAGMVKADGYTAFYKNKAQDGGAIYNKGTIELKSIPKFVNNEAIDTGDYDYYEGMGGAIFNAGNLTIENGVFTGNKAISGSSIWNEGNLTDTNSKYSSNHATAAGTIFHKEKTMSLNNPTISGNIADQNGGGIYTLGSFVVNDGVIKDNVAKEQGGALYCIPGYSSTPITIYLDGLVILNNTANQDGGAIYSSGKSALALHDTEIVKSVTGGNGGGVFLNVLSSIDLGNSVIVQNVANMGGGVYLSKGSTMTGNRNQVHDNTPDNIYQAK